MEMDWAAWIATYAPRIRPFTAYSRMLSQKELHDLVTASRPAPDLNGLTWPIVGVVLGELLASRYPDRALDTVPALVSSSTLSFAIFRAAAIYKHFDTANLVDRWQFARGVGGQQPRTLDTTSVARVCLTILEAADTSMASASTRESIRGPGVAVCRELLAAPHQPPRSLIARAPALSNPDVIFSGPREDRVVAVERLFHIIADAKDPEDREFIAIMLGYLTSRIAPGTMRHASILRALIEKYPTALLWYGFCAGLHGRFDSAFSRPREDDSEGFDFPASGRRIARDLMRPEDLFGAPSADIGVVELIALTRSGRAALATISSTTQTTLTVELIPGVVTAINAAGSKSQMADAPTNRSEPTNRATTPASVSEYDAGRLDRELRMISERIEQLRAELSSQRREPTGRDPQQPLFPKRKKR
jgi:hypothetical protein